MRIVQKAFAYVTNRDRLLVLRHPNSPQVGLQVPAGTIKHWESPQSAALREAQEETGLRSLHVESPLGSCTFNSSPYGENEIHERHFFHLEAVGEFPELWNHYESDPEGGSKPILFELSWVENYGEGTALFAEHGALLPRLRERCLRRPCS